MKNAMAGKEQSVTTMLSGHDRECVGSHAVENLTDCNGMAVKKLEMHLTKDLEALAELHLQQELQTGWSSKGQQISCSIRFQIVVDAGSIRHPGQSDEGSPVVTYTVLHGTEYLETKVKCGKKVVGKRGVD